MCCGAKPAARVSFNHMSDDNVNRLGIELYHCCEGLDTKWKHPQYQRLPNDMSTVWLLLPAFDPRRIRLWVSSYSIDFTCKRVGFVNYTLITTPAIRYTLRQQLFRKHFVLPEVHTIKGLECIGYQFERGRGGGVSCTTFALVVRSEARTWR